jgi:hypothetical protein
MRPSNYELSEAEAAEFRETLIHRYSEARTTVGFGVGTPVEFGESQKLNTLAEEPAAPEPQRLAERLAPKRVDQLTLSLDFVEAELTEGQLRACAEVGADPRDFYRLLHLGEKIQ